MWIEVCSTILRGRLPGLTIYVFSISQVKAQTKSLLVVGDHKFKVISVTSKKYILPGS